MKTILSIASALLLTLASCQQSTDQQLQEAMISVYDENPGCIGFIVSVESPDHNISWTGAVGYSNIDSSQVIDPYQPALIASNIKTYISATILRLVEQGKLDIHQSIKPLISDTARVLFESDGYDLDAIKVKHLLSHTSGIKDYFNKAYLEFVVDNPKHKWTRNEQMQLAISVGDPINSPGKEFSYADVNYLLLTEIIEHLYGEPFYSAMRKLLKYEELGLNNTWLISLEEKPAETKPLIHQYFQKYKMDSYDFDPSWDLYGGGGIACTMQDMAVFMSQLLNYNIVKDSTVLNQIYTNTLNNDTIDNKYYLGLIEYDFDGIKCYGHRGFWSTFTVYIPELNTTVASCPLELNMQEMNHEIIKRIYNILKPREFSQ